MATVSVVYHDDTGVDPTTIDPADIAVAAPGGAALTVQNVTVDATDPTAVKADYVVAAAGPCRVRPTTGTTR